MTDAELDKAIAELKRIDTYTHSINAQAVSEEALAAIATLREQVAAKDARIGQLNIECDLLNASCIGWGERAEQAEADNAALRKLLLRWLQIINRAKRDAASVAEWDKLRQETDAALLAGKDEK